MRLHFFISAVIENSKIDYFHQYADDTVLVIFAVG